MKKAKRLLAVMLAAVMLMTAAYLPSYAYIDANIYNPPSTGNIKNYYFTYEQSAGYLLDMLDHILREANLTITTDQLDEMVGVDIFGSGILGFIGLGLNTGLYEAGVTKAAAAKYGLSVPSGIDDGEGWIDLRNIDMAIMSLYSVADKLANHWMANLGDAVGLLGDLVDEKKGLGTLWSYSSRTYLRTTSNDILVLEYVVQLVANGLGPMIRGILGGTFNAGSLLEGTLNGLLQDFLGPRASLSTIGVGLKDLLYSLLINSEAEIMNGDNADGTQVNELDDPATPEVERVETVDDMVQQFIDWALVDGTGEFIYNGGNSMLGKNAEALLPGLADEELQKAGAANLGGITIQADRDLDGALETHTMSFYQLVANVLQALLGGMLTPMLTDLIVDLVGIEITEQYPNGDPSITSDLIYGLLLGSVTRDATSGDLSATAGAVENLLTANGAPELVIENYDSPELPVDTPVGHVTAVIKWFLDDGGLDSLIKIDYLGIHVQDNFMSLLDDLIRLAINLLPALGLEIESDLLYTPDDLNRYYAYDAEKNIIEGGTDAEVDSLYLTREAGEIVYVDTYIENPDGSKTPSIYCYFDSGEVVNTTNPSGADYRNPGFIRQYYVISTDKVYACVIKVVLDMLIDGCYFPEWAETIPSVLAYGLASLASPLLPENNYFARLDAYHEEETRSGDQFDENGVNVTPIPYEVEKTITVNDSAGAYTKTIMVPQAALDIGCSYLAAYLNNVLDLSPQEKLDTDTSLEKFAGEFLVWGFTEYLPMFTGTYENGAFVNYKYQGITVNDVKEGDMSLEEGIFQAEVNAYIAATYSDWGTRTPLYEDDNNAAYDAIYALIDSTLFKLIPTSWLPDLHGSQQIILDWLLGNICEFDLQGILNLLTVNTDADAELNKPVIEVLLRVIDRVLALIVNDHALLIDTNRSPVTTTPYPESSVKTLDALLDCNGEAAALPTFVYSLLSRIHQFKRPLLSTLLPLIFSATYERPYDEAYLGQKGISYYKVADLEDYTDRLTQHINATLVKSFDNEEDAEAACDGKAKSKRNDDGTYSIILSNETVYATYPDANSAASDLKLLDDVYYVAVESDEYDEETESYIIASYDVYSREDYMTASFDVNTTTDTSVDYGQQKYEYSTFNYASFTPRRAGASDFVSYGLEYQTFEPEDFSGAEYYYTNVNQSIDAAQEYASTYRSFVTSDLPAAYGDWFMYSIETQLRTKDIYDGNGDGVSVMAADTDGDGLPDDTDFLRTPQKNEDGTDKTDGNGNVIYDIIHGDDGEPSMPSSMYPFYTTAQTQFTFYDDMTSTNITSEYMNYFNATNYEQIALALEYAAEDRNDVALSEYDTESVIRLALFDTLGKNALRFDITYNADNQYDGDLQWGTLKDNYWTEVNEWLTDNDLRIEEILDENGAGTGNYQVLRPAFKLIDSSFSISTPDIELGSTPAHPTDSTLVAIDNMSVFDKKTDLQKNYKALYKAYRSYITALYQNRRSLYNIMDNVSYRHEDAERVRSIPMQNSGDLIILDWAIKHAKQYYMFDAGRNYMFTGVMLDDNVPEVRRVYTTTSFDVLQRAHDYAESLRKAILSSTVSTDTITQSMVTDAYQGILAAIRQLVDFTGDADWTQLDYYMAMADQILHHSDLNDYSGGIDVLTDVFGTASTLRADTTVDCERQDDVDEQAALLNTAIQNLVFKAAPSIVPNDSSSADTDTITVSNVNNRLVGHVFGLEEGVGITPDMYGEDGTLKIAGMTLDAEIGSDVGINPSGRGNGTGAYITGRVRTLERFRYYAVVYGDLNGDTRIDGSDASYVDYYIANGTNNEEEMGHVLFVAADTNHDNVVDASDVKYIRNHYTFKENVDANGDGVVDEKDTITQNEHRTESAGS